MHRHGWRMQGLPRPPLPAAARGVIHNIRVPYVGQAVVSPPPRPPPPLVSELDAAGLSHLSSKLVDGASCSTVEQLLSLSKEQLEALLDHMRLLPGRREQLLSFLAAKRKEGRKRQSVAAGRAGRHSDYDREWRLTLVAMQHAARQRARSAEHGPRADLTNGPFLNLGRQRGERPVRVPPSSARPSGVRVLTVSVSTRPGSAKNRVTSYEPGLPLWSTQ